MNAQTAVVTRTFARKEEKEEVTEIEEKTEVKEKKEGEKKEKMEGNKEGTKEKKTKAEGKEERKDKEYEREEEETEKKNEKEIHQNKCKNNTSENKNDSDDVLTVANVKGSNVVEEKEEKGKHKGEGKEIEKEGTVKQYKGEKLEETKKENEKAKREKGTADVGTGEYDTGGKEERITAKPIISKNNACDDDDSDYDGDNDDDNDEDDEDEVSECNDDVYDYDKNDGGSNVNDLKELETASKARNKKINKHFNTNKEKNKDDANAKYKKGDYEGAVQMWERGLRSISYVLSKKDELTAEKAKCFEKLHSTYCSNIAQGYLKLNNYSNCVKYSLQALENDKENEKIYFRLAKGYFLIGEYDKSIKVLQDALQVKRDPALINLLTVVKKKKEIHLTKEKCMMKRIFQSLKKEPLTNDCDASGTSDENKITLFFMKLANQIYNFLSFIMIIMSICFNHCCTFFNSTKKKLKLKRK